MLTTENKQMTVNGTNYYLVWNDEFDESELNREVWKNFGTPSDDEAVIIDQDGNRQAFHGKRHQVKCDGVYTKDSCAIIDAIHEIDADGEHSFINRQISTSGTMGYKYGYLEICAKLPGHPNAVAFWLGSEISDITNAFTELDIFETISASDDNDCKALTNIHSWDQEPSQKNSLDNYPDEKKKATKYCETLSKEFHIYGYEWNENVMNFYLDGECYYSFDINNSVLSKKPNGKDNTDTFRQPMRDLRLSSTMGLGFYGPIWSVGDPEKAELFIDYVRLYQRPEDNGELYINGKIVNPF